MKTKPHEHETFNTGAQRSDRIGKGRFDLIAPNGLKRLAIQYEAGAEHHGDARNWLLGFPISRAICSALGHINDHLGGDRGEDHLAAAAWQIFAAMEFEVLIEQGKLPVELNDVPFDSNTLPPDTGAERMKFYVTKMTDAYVRFRVNVSDGTAGELCMSKPEFARLVMRLRDHVEVIYPEVKQAPPPDKYRASQLRKIASWAGFDVLAKVDVPPGAQVWSTIEIHSAIIGGRMKGEIVKIGDKFVLRQRRDEPQRVFNVPPEEEHAFPFARMVEEPFGEIQRMTGSWANEKYPKTDAKAICVHLKREVQELTDAVVNDAAISIAVEAADCLLLLMHLAHKNNSNLLSEAIDKYIVNLGRTWATEPDSEGVYPHIEEPPEPEVDKLDSNCDCHKFIARQGVHLPGCRLHPDSLNIKTKKVTHDS